MLHAHIVKRKSKIQGFGLFATQPIKQGEVVWRLDPDDSAYTARQVRGLSGEIRRYLFQHGDRYIFTRDDSRFMNHSCDPNAWYEGDVAMVARRDIAAGEEVCWDYGTSEVEPPYRCSWRCGCGSPECRKHISDRDCLKKNFQERYRGHLTTWVEDYIRHRTAIEKPVSISAAIQARRVLARTLMLLSTLFRKASSVLVAAAAGASDVDEWVLRIRQERDEDRSHSLLDDEHVFSGLAEWENRLFSCLKTGGTVGIIGCGAGREMVALERQGCIVDGVDMAPRMVDAAKLYLVRAGAKGQVSCGDIFRFRFPRDRYDAFIFSWRTYGMIPSSERRIAVLRRLDEQLDEKGCIMLSVEPYHGWGRRPARLARQVARLLGNSVSLGPGDIFSPSLGTQHCFTREEIEQESHAAGFASVHYLHDGLRATAVLQKGAGRHA